MAIRSFEKGRYLVNSTDLSDELASFKDCQNTEYIGYSATKSDGKSININYTKYNSTDPWTILKEVDLSKYFKNSSNLAKFQCIKEGSKPQFINEYSFTGDPAGGGNSNPNGRFFKI